MRLVGILCWYDERPSWLGAAVTSMAFAGCEHVIALDGAIHGYPNGLPRSSYEEHAAIEEACRGAGIGCTIHVPAEIWVNEMAKRTFGFELGELVTDSEDWFLLMDGDQVIIEWGGLLGDLEEAREDVGEVLFWEYDGNTYPVRCLFRAQRGLRLVDNHYSYWTMDGPLCTTGSDSSPVANLRSIRIQHRKDRDARRDEAKRIYAARRDRAGLERISVEA